MGYSAYVGNSVPGQHMVGTVKSLRTAAHRQLSASLRTARLEARITQVQLSAMLGVPQSFVAKVEGMERRLDVVEFARWLSALGRLDLAGQIALDLAALDQAERNSPDDPMIQPSKS